MAQKTYISLDKLRVYDEKIKALINSKDADILASAKSYADGLASNYEATGAVETARVALQKNIDAVDAKADAAQSAADAAQSEVDALETLVGTLPEGTAATSVVDYVNVKTAGIATDAALGELNNQVTGLQGVVNGITADYLKAADKTELSDAIAAEETRAKGIEGGLETRLAAVEADYLTSADAETLQGNVDGVVERVAAIEEDYLKAADKTELEGKIGDKADQTALDSEVERATKAEQNLQTQINTIMNNPDAEGAINSINEFSEWVAEHGTVADGMRTDINKNKSDISALDAAYKAADVAIQGRLDVLEAIDHNAYVAADTALKNELNTEIGKKANAADVTASVEALTAADTAMQGRLDAIEAQLGDGEGSVADLISEAKQEAIDAAAADATSKDTALEAKITEAYKKYADDEDALIEARVATLETASATHALASDLTALTGRVTTAEGEIDTLQTEMDAVEAKALANESAIGTINTNLAKKADSTALDSAVGRIATLESWHNDFVEVSEAEINAMFTA